MLQGFKFIETLQCHGISLVDRRPGLIKRLRRGSWINQRGPQIPVTVSRCFDAPLIQSIGVGPANHRRSPIEGIAPQQREIARGHTTDFDDFNAVVGLCAGAAEIDNPDIGATGRIAGDHQHVRGRTVIAKHCLDLNRAAIADIVARHGQGADRVARRDGASGRIRRRPHLADALQPPTDDLNRPAKRAIDRENAVIHPRDT